MNEERKFLESMAKKAGGVLKIDEVLDIAKDENCILHKHFEWNDTDAANQYRREQARTLIQRCRITILDAPSVHVRAFVSLPSDRESGGGYRLTTSVFDDEAMKAEFKRDIQLTITRWTQKLYLIDDPEFTELILRMDAFVNRNKEVAQELAA